MSVWKDYDLYIFDFDGTICNTEPGITRALSTVLESHGYTRTRDELQVFIGPPLKTSLRRHIGIQDDEELTKIVAEYRRFYYDEKCTDESFLYPGIETILQTLHQKGKRLAVASLKPQKGLDYLTKKYNIDRYFDIICGPNEHEIPSTKEGVIDLVFNQIDNFEKAVMIGDSDFDVLGAHLSGIPCIAVHYGFGNHEALAAADVHAKTVDELTNLIL